MSEHCDHRSVGVIVRNPNEDILLLNRARFPFGLAAPAGHVDDHGGLEQAAAEEVFEEVGLQIPISGLRKVITSRRVDNQCRRRDGTYHVWTVYLADNVTGEIVPNQEETKGAGWWSPAELQALADSTRATIEQPANIGAQVLEPIWLDFLSEASLLR